MGQMLPDECLGWKPIKQQAISVIHHLKGGVTGPICSGITRHDADKDCNA